VCLPYDVATAVVDGLGDEPHEPDAAAAVHQVDAAGHLPAVKYEHTNKYWPVLANLKEL
jgi:hypothetical protein